MISIPKQQAKFHSIALAENDCVGEKTVFKKKLKNILSRDLDSTSIYTKYQFNLGSRRINTFDECSKQIDEYFHVNDHVKFSIKTFKHHDAGKIKVFYWRNPNFFKSRIFVSAANR